MEKLGQLDPRLSVLDAEFDETALEAEAGQAAQQAAAAAIEALALRDQAAATTTRARCGAVCVCVGGGKAVTGLTVWTSILADCHALAMPTNRSLLTLAPGMKRRTRGRWRGPRRGRGRNGGRIQSGSPTTSSCANRLSWFITVLVYDHACINNQDMMPMPLPLGSSSFCSLKSPAGRNGRRTAVTIETVTGTTTTETGIETGTGMTTSAPGATETGEPGAPFLALCGHLCDTP